MAYGGSQARIQIGGIAARFTPQLQQPQTQASSVSYTPVHGNARSLTH